MPALPLRILVADDDPTFRDILEIRLQEWGYGVRVAAGAREAEAVVREWKPDLILTDVVMPETSGIQLLARLRAAGSQSPVILLTAHGTVEMAVEAMKLGAVDFLTKPLNHSHLRAVIEEVLARPDGAVTNGAGADRVDAGAGVEDAAGAGGPGAGNVGEPAADRAGGAAAGSATGPKIGRHGMGPFIGTSRAMREVYELVHRVAESDAPVLITGESGTGKELVARYIHDNSARRDEAFIPVNAAAIPRDLMESEIFGHEKGAFTGAVSSRPGCFEMADGGTLFLDEIGEMPRELQPKLLRVLDEAKIRRLGGSRELSLNVRTLTATNRNPRKAVKEGVLREDLFFRLNVLQVHLPPLRDRENDTSLLARRFAETFSRRHGGPERIFEDETLELLQAYSWPGNVRELRNLVERAVVLAGDGRIGPAELPPYVRNPEAWGAGSYSFPPDATVADVERALILRTLDATGNNKSETARRLGVSVRTIRNKLQGYGIDR
jgi:DNA-binding NtrC family response regulator